MFRSKLAFLGACVFVCVQLASAAAHAENFQLYDARLVITSDLSDQDMPNGDKGKLNFGKAAIRGRTRVFSEYKKYEAEIRVTEMDPDTLATRQTNVPVLATFEYTGLLAKTEATAGNMGIHGLKGKSISDVLGRYEGGQGGLGVLVNLDEMYISNDKGIAINDVQTFVWGFGISGSKVTVYISATDSKDVKTQAAPAPNSKPTETTATMAEALSRRLN